MLAPDETVVWFEWGTDTHYGNITGLTTVPGNSASNNISATLNGLPGNFYHYRLAAANDFGVAYGADKAFTVAAIPSVTTLFPTQCHERSDLGGGGQSRGMGHHGLFYRWGNGNFANVTPGMDIGSRGHVE